ncbi:MAG: methylaspartate mutase subunit E [Desulfobacterales bacterium]|nr:methylaspartate mutase subunit E [Desulfobacterales bacterium]
MEIKNERIERQDYMNAREEILSGWPTGQGVSIEEGIKYQHSLPESKRFAKALNDAVAEKRVLIQPRAGVALVDENIELLKFLETEADLLPTTIDAYTRLNRYEEAQKGIEKSKAAGHSLLNGFPAVNHGVEACRRMIEAVEKPVEVRHGTPDARLLAEIAYAAGFTSYEGGGLSYNLPYAKNVPLEQSIRHWQFIDRLTGIYQEEGITINREPFGPLSGTLVPPFVSHTIAIIEGLLALEQGVKSLTLGYGQAGNMVQDIAAMQSLTELAHKYFTQAGHQDYELSTVLHQWMGGFPEDEARAFAVISWGSVVANLSGATKVIVKTPHEASGIPTKEANLQGLKATRQMIQMTQDQCVYHINEVEAEKQIIIREVEAIMDAVFEAGNGDVALGAVRAVESGLIDVPFAPASCNYGKLLPVRDHNGAVRVFETGNTPLPADVVDFHKEKIQERATAENRDACFQMVIDDIYAISKGRLVGRPK